MSRITNLILINAFKLREITSVAIAFLASLVFGCDHRWVRVLILIKNQTKGCSYFKTKVRILIFIRIKTK